MVALERERCPLTDRQLDVVAMVAEGYGDAEIARLRHVSINTAERDVARIKQRVGARNRTHLAAMAVRNRWIP